MQQRSPQICYVAVGAAISLRDTYQSLTARDYMDYNERKHAQDYEGCESGECCGAPCCKCSAFGFIPTFHSQKHVSI